MKKLLTAILMCASMTDLMAMDIIFEDVMDQKKKHSINVTEDTTYITVNDTVEQKFTRKVERMVAEGTLITEESWPRVRTNLLKQMGDTRVIVFFKDESHSEK